MDKVSIFQLAIEFIEKNGKAAKFIESNQWSVDRSSISHEPAMIKIVGKFWSEGIIFSESSMEYVCIFSENAFDQEKEKLRFSIPYEKVKSVDLINGYFYINGDKVDYTLVSSKKLAKVFEFLSLVLTQLNPDVTMKKVTEEGFKPELLRCRSCKRPVPHGLEIDTVCRGVKASGKSATVI